MKSNYTRYNYFSSYITDKIRLVTITITIIIIIIIIITFRVNAYTLFNIAQFGFYIFYVTIYYRIVGLFGDACRTCEIVTIIMLRLLFHNDDIFIQSVSHAEFIQNIVVAFGYIGYYNVGQINFLTYFTRYIFTKSKIYVSSISAFILTCGYKNQIVRY
ncbi:membrane protein [Candidatus Magnetobacterium bavaricum]|uniref:Membrane protein n=1 Tax=Candidatus Magnetobacterium bavaricum TaxID=29290 RepID=A0A0F3GHM6_9BACT|nr:membrane protein [Candidatus Magnetobacterium bavaricum]